VTILEELPVDFDLVASATTLEAKTFAASREYYVKENFEGLYSSVWKGNRKSWISRTAVVSSGGFLQNSRHRYYSVIDGQLKSTSTPQRSKMIIGVSVSLPQGIF
jgi:hypothetical protein